MKLEFIFNTLDEAELVSDVLNEYWREHRAWLLEEQSLCLVELRNKVLALAREARRDAKERRDSGIPF